MALTSGQKTTRINEPFGQIRHSMQSISGTFYPGQFVMILGDSGYVTPVTESTVAGTVGCGLVLDQQTVTNTGDYLTFYEGDFVVSGSGFSATSWKKPFFVGGDNIPNASQGTNRIVCGRVISFVTGAYGTNNIKIRVGGVVSGTLATTIY